jgi:hypothetical protein
MPLIKIAGMLNRNEYLAADSLSICLKNPPVMDEPERDVPGTNESDWKKPIIIESLIPSLSIVMLLFVNFSAAKIINENTIIQPAISYMLLN